MALTGTTRTGEKANQILLTTKRRLAYTLRAMASPLMMTAVGSMGTAITTQSSGIACARNLFEIMNDIENNPNGNDKKYLVSNLEIVRKLFESLFT